MSVKKPRSKRATIAATYRADLGLILSWLKLNKAITAHGEIRALRNDSYAVSVKSKVNKASLNDLVKDKFGIFAKVI
jgi:hypothetical protein